MYCMHLYIIRQFEKSANWNQSKNNFRAFQFEMESFDKFRLPCMEKNSGYVLKTADLHKNPYEWR